MIDKPTLPPVSAKTILSMHELATNCFVASVGTFWNSMDESQLRDLSKQWREQASAVKKTPDPMFPPGTIELYSEALDQANTILATDSITQRITRSVSFAGDIVALKARYEIGRVLAGKEGEVSYPMPPISFTPNPSKTPGRCK